MTENHAKRAAKALGAALNQGVTKSAEQDIGEMKWSACPSNIGVKPTIKARLKVHHVWFYILVTLMALTSAVALHIYQAIGLLK